MPLCNFDQATGQFHSGAMHPPLPFDPSTEVQVLLDNYPDKRTQRWDPNTQALRPATADEMTAFDLAKRSPLAQALDTLLAAPNPTLTQIVAVLRIWRQQVL